MAINTPSSVKVSTSTSKAKDTNTKPAASSTLETPKNKPVPVPKANNPDKKPAPAAKTSNRTINKSATTLATLPWKTLLGLTLILAELWLNTGVIWGLFMLLWATMGINSGQTYILEILDRKVHPILFWFTIHLWLLFAAFFFMGNNHVYGLAKIIITKIVGVFS